jgi:FADH2 O2-dependent halogenase
MTTIDCDIAVLGSGFGGTLLAIIAQRLGFAVALLERGSHPRFAIGESSTPLADFRVAAIADRFGLDWLRPFSKYGTWKAAYPDIPCGLKRGFSFFRHEAGRAHIPCESNRNALLVSASPTDARSDTHWFRAAFDAHLVDRAVQAGVSYVDHLETDTLRHDRGWVLEGTRPDGPVVIRAGFLIDATGDGQMLGRTLGLEPVAPTALRARSRALYSHFRGVKLFHDLLAEEYGPQAVADHPFPCDAAALHHVIDHGWMWVLRFENGITSAGFSLDPEHHPLRAGESPETEWARLLQTYASLERIFASSEPVRPFARTGRLQRRWSRAAGDDWALLPHAAGFLDAWLSPGIAQTLFAVERLGLLLAEDRRGTRRERRLADYSNSVLRELAWVDELTAACFASFDRFEVLATVTMVYFVAAIYCEERERAGRAGPEHAFLLADDSAYREIAAEVFRQAPSVSSAESEAFAVEVQRRLKPFNLAGLCDPQWRNMYPFLCGL